MLMISGKVGSGGGPSDPGKGFNALANLVSPIAALDILALIALGVWVLRPPGPGALGFFGRWLGKVLLFLGLGLAIVIFFFTTCWVILQRSN